jgi:hypothetical protein
VQEGGSKLIVERPYTNLTTFSFGEAKNAFNPMLAPRFLVRAAFASCVNPSVVWQQLTVHWSAYELALEAGELSKRRPAFLSPAVAEGYLAHRGLTLLKGNNLHTDVWNDVETCAEMAGCLGTLGEQCLYVCSRDTAHGLVRDENWPRIRSTIDAAAVQSADAVDQQQEGDR